MGYGIGKTAESMPFIYNIDKLQRFKAAKAQVAVGVAGTPVKKYINVISDSIGEANLASGYFATSWVSLLRNRLATLYGDVGRGIIPYFVPTSTSSYPALWTFTGTWAEDFGGYGIASYVYKTYENGATATIAFNGTGIGLEVVTGPSMGASKVVIDGVDHSFTTYSASLVPAAKIEITGLSAGDHTAVITNQSWLYLLGAYEIKGTNGLVVNNMSKWGGKIAGASLENAMKAEIDVWSPCLTIIALIANDFNQQTSLSYYEQKLEAVIVRALQYGDVLLTTAGLYEPSTQSIPQTDYVNIVKKLALKYDCALLDIFNKWHGNYAYADTTLGYMVDGVHPNDFGHFDIADAVWNVLMNM